VANTGRDRQRRRRWAEEGANSAATAAMGAREKAKQKGTSSLLGRALWERMV